MIKPVSRQNPIATNNDDSQNRPTVLFPAASPRSISGWGPRIG